MICVGVNCLNYSVLFIVFPDSSIHMFHLILEKFIFYFQIGLLVHALYYFSWERDRESERTEREWESREREIEREMSTGGCVQDILDLYSGIIPGGVGDHVGC